MHRRTGPDCPSRSTPASPATVRGPDAAVIRRDRLPDPHHAGFFYGAPDLAVEVVSPSNRAAETAEKVSEYLAAGARAVWVVDPRARTVAVHEASRDAAVVSATGVLDGGNVVPGAAPPGRGAVRGVSASPRDPRRTGLRGPARRRRTARCPAPPLP